PAYLDSLAWGYYKKGDYKKAKELLEKVLKSMSDDPVINEHYADVLSKIGQKQEALNYYKKALKLIEEKGEGEPGQKDRVLKKLK
ncbi:MAG TPA: tetratricopeptide repeat protein, partial [Sulfurihydrogenibium azorense]|nr:tetratricopeptide repeat protein [Sulfurihydrogenibium azorense]